MSYSCVLSYFLFVLVTTLSILTSTFGYYCTLAKGHSRLQNTLTSPFYMRSNDNMGEKAKENLVKGVKTAKDAIDNDDTDELKGSAVGAIVGGTVLGPLGAVMGAAVGRDIAYNNKQSNKINGASSDNSLQQICGYLEEEIQKAQDVLLDMNELRDNDKKRAVALNREAAGLYELAKEVVANGDDIAGKNFLTKRQDVMEKCEGIVMSISRLESEISKQEMNINKLKEKLTETISIYEREVEAKRSLDQQEQPLGQDVNVPILDPIERKFRDLERK